METANQHTFKNLISLSLSPVKAEVQSLALWLNKLPKHAFYRHSIKIGDMDNLQTGTFAMFHFTTEAESAYNKAGGA